MKIHETKIELKEVEIKRLIGIQCDECNCEIYPSEIYYEVTTGHTRADYSDSLCKNLDLCSIDCLSKNMKDYYLNKCTGETSFYDVVERIYNNTIEGGL